MTFSGKKINLFHLKTKQIGPEGHLCPTQLIFKDARKK